MAGKPGGMLGVRLEIEFKTSFSDQGVRQTDVIRTVFLKTLHPQVKPKKHESEYQKGRKHGEVRGLEGRKEFCASVFAPRFLEEPAKTLNRLHHWSSLTKHG